MKQAARNGDDEDGSLVLRCKQGDVDAFELLVQRHQKRMMNIAFRMTGNYDDACEIVQDAFVAAYKGIKRFEERSRFSTWLYTIVVNQTRNFLKSAAARERGRELSLDGPIRSEEGRVSLDLPSAEPSALDTLERREVQSQVQECVKALAPEFREIIVLRDIQGFSYEEAGAMLGIAEGTVKSRLFRARESVKDCLKRLLGRP